MTSTPQTSAKRQPIARGISRTGPVLFSYGFRPFFFGAGLWAVVAMTLWVAALAAGWPAGGSYGAPSWHAHEMLFGYTSAALAGFLLTAVPNWTGRLPVAGAPLMVLFALWCAGRLALLAPDVFGLAPSMLIDATFLPALLAICAREIIAGRKWKDLKILGGILALAGANGAFHWLVLNGGDLRVAGRLGVAAYVLLITIMGGRVVPSFTRNWLAKRLVLKLPAVYSWFDTTALLVGLVALGLWTLAPELGWTCAICAIAAVLHGVRLARWRGWQTTAEPLVFVLHVGYGFVPLGFAAVAAAQVHGIDPVAGLHVFTVGAIGVMTLAIMSRATRGHTGLPLSASETTTASYALLILAALLRPLASFWVDAAIPLLSLTGACWVGAFALYLFEYGPALLALRRERAEIS